MERNGLCGGALEYEMPMRTVAMSGYVNVYAMIACETPVKNVAPRIQ